MGQEGLMLVDPEVIDERILREMNMPRGSVIIAKRTGIDSAIVFMPRQSIVSQLIEEETLP